MRAGHGYHLVVGAWHNQSRAFIEQFLSNISCKRGAFGQSFVTSALGLALRCLAPPICGLGYLKLCMELYCVQATDFTGSISVYEMSFEVVSSNKWLNRS